MKLNLKALLMTLLVVTMALSSCRRNNNDDPTPSQTETEQAKQTNSVNDEQFASSETDDVMNDVDDFINTQGRGLRRDAPPSSPLPTSWFCGGNVTVDSVLIAQKQYTLIFNNNNCNGRIRNGRVIIKLESGNRWPDQGAIIRVTFDNLSITRSFGGNNRTIVLNGSHTVTNVNGGRIIDATSSRTIEHKVRGRMLINFGDGSFRSWSVYRRRLFTSGNQGLQIRIKGDTTLPNKTLVDCIGINRYDEPFISRIPTDIQSNAQCGFWKPFSGQKVHEASFKALTITFGLNSAGNAVALGTCATHYRLQTATGNTATFNILLPY